MFIILSWTVNKPSHVSLDPPAASNGGFNILHEANLKEKQDEKYKSRKIKRWRWWLQGLVLRVVVIGVNKSGGEGQG